LNKGEVQGRRTGYENEVQEEKGREKKKIIRDLEGGKKIDKGRKMQL